MPQISIYLDDSIAEKLDEILKERELTASEYVASIITEQMLDDESDEIKKIRIIRELRGSLFENNWQKSRKSRWK